MSTPAIILNSSPYTCCGLPTPPDAILILPGLALAYAIRSGTDLAETEGCTTNTLVSLRGGQLAYSRAGLFIILAQKPNTRAKALFAVVPKKEAAAPQGIAR